MMASIVADESLTPIPPSIIRASADVKARSAIRTSTIAPSRR
jgi:hypothetical protein